MVCFKGVLWWCERDGLVLSGCGAVEVIVVDGSEKVLWCEWSAVDEFGVLYGSFIVLVAASLGYYVVWVASGENFVMGFFEVQEYRKSEFDVDVEFASDITLQQKNTKQSINPQHTIKLTIQITNALSNEHTHNILHNDLHPNTIIITHKNSTKILEFNISH